jgi:hypothetical protein
VDWNSVLRRDASIPGEFVLVFRIQLVDDEDGDAGDQAHGQNKTAYDDCDFHVALQIKELQ